MVIKQMTFPCWARLRERGAACWLGLGHHVLRPVHAASTLMLVAPRSGILAEVGRLGDLHQVLHERLAYHLRGLRLRHASADLGVELTLGCCVCLFHLPPDKSGDAIQQITEDVFRLACTWCRQGVAAVRQQVARAPEQHLGIAVKMLCKRCMSIASDISTPPMPL